MTGTQRKNLDKLLSGNAADVFDAAVFFDSIGMFILPGETAAAFAARAERMICEIDSLGAGTSKYMEFCKGAESIDNSICEAAVGIAEKAYGFRADWVPALKSGRRAGLLSEGILYEIDGVLPLVFIKIRMGGMRRLFLRTRFAMPQEWVWRICLRRMVSAEC